jgi:hypothetical protein
MRLFIGLIAYLIGSAALVAGSAAAVDLLATPYVARLWAELETRAVGPRVQMWLDRKAEEVVYAERRKAAERAEQERWAAIRAKIKIPSATDYAAFARARDEDIEALERENAARAKREALQQARELRAAENAAAPRAVQPGASPHYPDIHGRVY